MTLNPQNREFWLIFCYFELQHAFQEWIAPKWQETDQDNMHMKFSALNLDFSNLSSDPLDSRRPTYVGVKEGFPS